MRPLLQQQVVKIVARFTTFYLNGCLFVFAFTAFLAENRSTDPRCFQDYSFSTMKPSLASKTVSHNSGNVKRKLFLWLRQKIKKFFNQNFNLSRIDRPIFGKLFLTCMKKLVAYVGWQSTHIFVWKTGLHWHISDFKRSGYCIKYIYQAIKENLTKNSATISCILNELQLGSSVWSSVFPSLISARMSFRPLAADSNWPHWDV